MSDLCNFSINSWKSPDRCKVAKLRPLYEKGSLTQPCNYRPISLLPLISKVIEEVIQDQTSIFWNQNNYYTLTNLVFEKTFYRFLPFLSEWINFKGLWQGFDNWHDFSWSSKDLWHNWSWLTFAKIICYRFLETYCKLVSIWFIQQIISG